MSFGAFPSFVCTTVVCEEYKLMDVRQKNKIKLSLPEESKVTRDLGEIRKNA
jgi:hypothetical protein